MEVELADLQALLVLAETLHFGKAADRLHCRSLRSANGSGAWKTGSEVRSWSAGIATCS